MAYQKSDLVTLVQQRVRDTAYSTTEITGYLNDAQNDVFNEYPNLPFFEATQTYTVNTSTSDITNGLGVPTNLAQAIDLIYTGSDGETLIQYKDYKELDLLYPDLDDLTEHPAGKPQYWYMYALTPRVFPIPSTAYTVLLRYYKKPTLLAADADVPTLPSQFQELLVLGASYRVLQVKDNYDQAAILQNKFNEQLQKLVVQTAQRQVGRPIQMGINRAQVGKRHF